MNIVLIEKIVPKANPTSNYKVCDQIRGIQKNHIGNYYSDYIPKVGEVIWYTNDNYYYVLNVIHTIKKSASPIYSNLPPNEIEVIVEVCLRSNYQFYISLNSLLGSEIPLVTEIDDYT